MTQLFVFLLEDEYTICCRGADALRALQAHFSDQDMFCSSSEADDEELDVVGYAIDEKQENSVQAMFNEDEMSWEERGKALEPYLTSQNAWIVMGTLSKGSVINAHVRQVTDHPFS